MAVAETVLTNALLVLPGEVRPGTILLRGGLIADVQPGRSALAVAEDLGGDPLIPGAVDLHTDNLEPQAQPRADARWPSRSAMLAHDAQCAAAGVTTVLDALRVGDLGFNDGRDRTSRDRVRDLDGLAGTGLLRSEHFLHLRCELPAPDMPAALDAVADRPLLRMVSLMDHTPGFGQHRNVGRNRAMRVRQRHMAEDEVARRFALLVEQRRRLREPQRRWLLHRFAGRDLPLASHDDDSAEMDRNKRDGITVSEFPVLLEAARHARATGVAVIAGAPNVVRGGSHSGDVAALDLVRDGAADALASDYVPGSLIEAAWRCAAEGALSLPAAVAPITDTPARMARLHDRGRVAPGLRADLVRVREHEGLPVVRQAWRAGGRVA